MADLTAKIGADSSQFRSDVGSLPGVVKSSFGQMKNDSEGGIAENVKGLKAGFRELKEFVVAGGIVEAVKRFFEFSIEAANKSKDANDENAAAVRRFGEALESSKEAAGHASVAIVGTFNRIGESIGAGIKGAIALAKGTFDAWGEGERILEDTDKAARSAELSLAEAKKHAEDFKKLNEEAKTLAEQREEMERKSLSLGDQKNVLEQKLLEAQRAEADAGDNALARRTAVVEQMKLGNKLIEVEKGLRDEAEKQDQKRVADADAIYKIQLAALEPVQREKLLRENIADLQALINSGLLSAKNVEELRVQLGEREKGLAETLNKEHEKEVEFKKKAALDTEQQIEIEKLLAKGATGRTAEENVQLAVLRLQSAEKATHLRIQELLEKKVSEGLTPAEQTQLNTLIKQDDSLKDQIKQKQDLISATVPQVEGEKAVTSEMEKQAAAAEKVRKEKEAAKAAVEVKTVSRGESYSNISTLALQGMEDRYKSALEKSQADSFGQFGGVGGKIIDPSIAMYQDLISKIEKELSGRSDVEYYIKTFGQDAAVKQYGDQVTQKALTDLNATSQQSASSLGALAAAITKSPIFAQ